MGVAVTVTLHHSDMLAWLSAYDGPLFDSCVTDPPYEIGFMGKGWDDTGVANRVETWRAVYDALKPGAHLVAFAATRTYHRMACAIEDAGFEIRDQLAYCYGTGFPKSHNINKALGKQNACCQCENPVYEVHDVCSKNVHGLRQGLASGKPLSGDPQQDVREDLRGKTPFADEARQTGESAQAGGNKGSARAASRLQHDLRPVCSSDVSKAFDAQNECREVLQPSVSERDAQERGAARPEPEVAGREQSSLEGWCHAQAPEGELQGRSVCASTRMGEADGPQGRLHHGASPSDGENVRLPADANGSGQPYRPQSVEQYTVQSRIVSDECGSQARGGWAICAGCGKPRVPEGLGSALKPAWEPICLARKPLSEKSVAANVLKHGTGAINVDACRVGTEVETWPKSRSYAPGQMQPGGVGQTILTGPAPQGRWPANLVHDGSDEVVSGFPETAAALGGAVTSKPGLIYGGGAGLPSHTTFAPSDNGGSAARFFYSAKAGPLDRIGTAHATVKPVDLMRWLCRLITPPGGHILEPFAGSGTTGIAAMAEGFDCTMIEMEAEHVADIERKLAFLRGEGGVGLIEKHKARIDRTKDEGHGPLFGEVAA